MNKVQANRLLNVARACRETKDRFDMTTYGHGCGTPACALGNYAARRDLQKTLKLGSDGYGVRVFDNDGTEVCFVDEEVLNHFGITRNESYDLFDFDGCGNARSSKAKAARFIERFVAKRTAL